ncbi:MAG: DivIVA domain-containing protein [Sciscionella sp.]
MQREEDTELVPLKPGFDVVMRGFDRAQVQRFVDAVHDEIRMFAADRDSAMSRAEALNTQLDTSRTEVDRLGNRVDELCRAPMNAGELSERLERMLTLANTEASEVIARAQAAAEHTWTSAEESAKALRARYQRMLSELDEQREEMIVEHRSTMEHARTEVTAMTTDAEQRRHTLDAEAEARRAAIEDEFQRHSDAARASMDSELAQAKAGSEAEAKRRIDEARATADSLVSEARALATRTTEDADKRAKAAIEKADAYAKRTTEDAVAKADAMVADATEKSTGMLDEARNKANATTGDASAHARSVRKAASQHAEQLLGNAKTESARRVEDATNRVTELRALRAQLGEQLSKAHGALAAIMPGLHEPEDEQRTLEANGSSGASDVPVQRKTGALRQDGEAAQSGTTARGSTTVQSVKPAAHEQRNQPSPVTAGQGHTAANAPTRPGIRNSATQETRKMTPVQDSPDPQQAAKSGR